MLTVPELELKEAHPKQLYSYYSNCENFISI